MSNENDGGWGSFDWVSGADTGGGGLSGADWGGFSWGNAGWSGLGTDFFDFAGGVGRDQNNARDDVIKLEGLLGNSGHYDVSRTDGPTGWWGTPLEDGLKSYQKEKGLTVDGFVLPKGETLGSLKDDLLDTFKGFHAPNAFEVDRHHTNNRRGEGGLLVDRPPPLTFHPNPGLPKLEADAFQANRRSAGNLAQIADPGDFPNLAKLAVGDYGDKAIVELRDLVGKIGAIDPQIADVYGRVIKNVLEPEDRVKFLGGADRPDPPLGVLKAEAEARFGPFPSPDEARQALADDIARWGEDADQNATITEENGVVIATSEDGTHIAIRDTERDVDQLAPEELNRLQTDAGGKGGKTDIPTNKTPANKKEPLNPLILGLPEKPYDHLKKVEQNPEDWGNMREQLANTPNMTLNEATAYLTIFGSEGGMQKNLEGGSAVGGIVQKTLNWVKGRVPELESVTKTTDLKIEQMPVVYRTYFDAVLKNAGKHEALNSVPDSSAAATLADTLFRNGGTGGGNIIRAAINDAAGKDVVGATGMLNKQALAAYNDLVSRPETRYRLMDKIGELRDVEYPEDDKRNEFFRFRETW